MLFKLPRSSKVILGLDSEVASQYPDVFKSIDEDPWLSTTAIMMYESSLGSQSHWKPYFDVLPESFDTLIFWRDDELFELQASAVVDKIGKVSAEENFTSILLPVIKQLPLLSALDDKQLLELYHRMGSTIMAYAFDVEPSPSTLNADEEGYVSDEDEEQLPKCMVPLADMLNADALRNNARLFYEEDCLEMRSTQPVKAGDELFNDYGELPRSELLRRYGYITDNYKSYDVVEIDQELIKEAIREGTEISVDDMIKRLDYLEDREELDEAYDLNRPDPSTQQGTQERLVSITMKDILLPLRMWQIPREAFEAVRSTRSKPKLLPSPDSSEFAGLVNLLLSIARKRLASYATTLEDDLRLRGTADRLSRRHLMALEVRIGEKEILHELISTCNAFNHEERPTNGGIASVTNRANGTANYKANGADEASQALAASTSSADEPSSKRRRVG